MLTMKQGIGAETQLIRKYATAIGGLTNMYQWLLIVDHAMSVR